MAGAWPALSSHPEKAGLVGKQADVCMLLDGRHSRLAPTDVPEATAENRDRDVKCFGRGERI